MASRSSRMRSIGRRGDDIKEQQNEGYREDEEVTLIIF